MSNQSEGQSSPGPTDFAQRYGPWAVVTGAAAGVGLAFTEELMGRGLDVVMVDVSPEIEAVGAELTDRLGRSHLAVEIDVTSPTWIELLRQACAGLSVGLAVANAGVSFVGRYLDMTEAERARLVAVNCTATAELASWAIPPMVERGRGGFVVMSSGSALAGTAGVALYSATKAFGVNLAEAIGWEVKDHGVDTLAVCGPAMSTPAMRGQAPNTEFGVEMVEPSTVVGRALDALGEGGRWLPDEGMEFIAGASRADAVELMSQSTTAMFPHHYRSE